MLATSGIESVVTLWGVGAAAHGFGGGGAAAQQYLGKAREAHAGAAELASVVADNQHRIHNGSQVRHNLPSLRMVLGVHQAFQALRRCACEL